MKIIDISFRRLENRFGPGSDLPELADMLRYDVAFQCTTDPHLVAFPKFRTKDGAFGGTVTHGRWHSFGVKVSDSDIPSSTIHSIFKDQWVTYRHPRIRSGVLDYAKLVPVTLEAYCQAKDTQDL